MNISFGVLIKFQAFIGILIIMLVWEWLLPRRKDMARLERCPKNLALFFVNTMALIALPISAVGFSSLTSWYKFGLFNWVEVNYSLKIIISVVMLDFIIYWQHRIFHTFAPLWKIHRIHHTDNNCDVTTALRFHPIEIIFSALLKGAVIFLLGAPIMAVVIFEIMLFGMAMFNHSNIRLTLVLDQFLRRIIVTPDMHRVHHSIYPHEHNTNYGFFMSQWDHLFNSYTAQPQDGHEAMQIGLDICHKEQNDSLLNLLLLPFKK